MSSNYISTVKMSTFVTLKNENVRYRLQIKNYNSFVGYVIFIRTKFEFSVGKNVMWAANLAKTSIYDLLT